MPIIPGGIPITSFISPTDSADTYPTHDSKYGKGGWVEVANLSARDDIAPERRKEGMVAYVIEYHKAYRLKGGISNSNWDEWAPEAGPQGPAGGPQGPLGFQGPGGIDGANTFRWIYQTADGTVPDIQKFTNDNTSFTTPNQIFRINDYDNTTNNRSSWLAEIANAQALDRFTRIQIRSVVNNSIVGTYLINSATDQGEFYDLNVTLINGSGTMVLNQTYAFSLSYSGNRGFQGVQGRQGPIGMQGDQGVQGVQGVTGAGVQGAQGNQGDQGVQGAQGNQGVQGNQGNQGVQGHTGRQGNQGAQGAQGNQGVQGNQGNQGVQGHTGRQGNQGVQGVGVQGVQGNQGILGPTGLGYLGLTSNSSRTLAVGSSFTFSTNLSFGQTAFIVGSRIRAIFSATEWGEGVITSYVGNSMIVLIDATSVGLGLRNVWTFAIAGNVGLTGAASFVPGPKGDQGPTGRQGSQGNQGNIGTQGNQGNVGAQGTQGNQGNQGNAGPIGFTGSIGIQGNDGANSLRFQWNGFINGATPNTGDFSVTPSMSMSGLTSLVINQFVMGYQSAVDVSSWFNSLKTDFDSSKPAYLQIRDTINPENFGTYNVTSITYAGVTYTIGISALHGRSNLVNGRSYSVSWQSNGAKGNQGPNGRQGNQGVQGVGAGAIVGSANYIPKFTSNDTGGNSNIYDTGTNIGIGTITPGSKLDVNGSYTVNSGLTNNSNRPGIAMLVKGEFRSYSSNLGVLGDDGFLRLSAGGGTNAATGKSYIELSGYSNVTDMDRNLVFGTAGAERMRINSNGDVAIGSTNMSQGVLHIRQNSTLGGTPGNYIQLSSISNSGGSAGNIVYIKDYALRGTTSLHQNDWQSWKSHNSIDIDGVHAVPGTNTRTFWERDPWRGFQYFGNESTYTLSIDSLNGRIGINQKGPEVALHVGLNNNGYSSGIIVDNYNGGSNAVSQIMLRNYGTWIHHPAGIRQWANSGNLEIWNIANASTIISTNNTTPRFWVNGNGTVAVNTADPNLAQFSVNNDALIRSYNTTFRMSEGATFKNDCVVGWNVANKYTHFGNYQNYPLALRTNDQDRVWIAANGNVGIGATSPNEKLEVNGNIKISTTSTGKTGILGQVGGSDFWFVGGGADSGNAGYLEIATGDDANVTGAAEPIYVSQYGLGSPLTGTLTTRATLLDNLGNTTFPGVTNSTDFRFNGDANYRVARRYQSFQTMTINKDGFSALFTVTGKILATNVKVTFKGSIGNVVINATANIISNHSQDIFVKSEGGGYTPIELRIASDTSGNYSLQGRLDTYVVGNCLLDIEVFPLGSETVVFGNTILSGGATVIHNCIAGINISGTDGTTNIGNLKASGNITAARFIGSVDSAAAASGGSFFTAPVPAGSETQIGCEGFNGLNRAYLFNNAGGWGLYSWQGGDAIIFYNRALNRVESQGNMVVTSNGGYYNLKLSTTVPVNQSANLLYSQHANNDMFRINVGGGDNDGYVELATADDGTEPIYVRQYSGPFQTIVRSASLLNSTGNTSFPKTVFAVGFSSTSDIRLKNVISKDYSVSNISDIQPISYTWKDESKGTDIEVGYSAQEVQKCMPSAVVEDEDGMLAVKYNQVLIAKIAELEKRIAQLENGL